MNWKCLLLAKRIVDNVMLSYGLETTGFVANRQYANRVLVMYDNVMLDVSLQKIIFEIFLSFHLSYNWKSLSQGFDMVQ